MCTAQLQAVSRTSKRVPSLSKIAHLSSFFERSEAVSGARCSCRGARPDARRDGVVAVVGEGGEESDTGEEEEHE
jgi:hypothetical protein